MNTGSGRMFGMHRCAAAGCKVRIARRHFLCSDHYAMVPAGLRVRLNEQLQYGIAWKCHPTQRWLDLRSQAINAVAQACRRKFGPAAGEQFSLLPSH